MQVPTIGLDLAKHVFQIHGIDAAEKVVVRKQLRHSEVIGVLRGSAAVPDRHGARFLLTEFHLNKIFSCLIISQNGRMTLSTRSYRRWSCVCALLRAFSPKRAISSRLRSI